MNIDQVLEEVVKISGKQYKDVVKRYYDFAKKQNPKARNIPDLFLEMVKNEKKKR